MLPTSPVEAPVDMGHGAAPDLMPVRDDAPARLEPGPVKAGVRNPVSTHQEDLMTVQQETKRTAGTTAQEKAQEKQKENETAAEEMRKLQAGDAPTDLKDWPNGPAKYLTYGSNEENEVYGEGVTAKLGPANLKRFDDGSITIDDKKVDNPDDYKGKPLAGGPTDPNAPSS